MRDRVEPIADGHGKAREGLFVAALCSSHQIGVHYLFRLGRRCAPASPRMGSPEREETQSSDGSAS
jgi:hypothetical protein